MGDSFDSGKRLDSTLKLKSSLLSLSISNFSSVAHTLEIFHVTGEEKLWQEKALEVKQAKAWYQRALRHPETSLS